MGEPAALLFSLACDGLGQGWQPMSWARKTKATFSCPVLSAYKCQPI